MKKFLLRIIVLAVSFLVAFACMAGCTGDGEVKDDMDIEALTDPFWRQNIMYNESVAFIQGETGLPQGRLYFSASEIISVKSASLQETYQEGKDYKLENGNIVWVEGSAMPYITTDMLDCKVDFAGDPMIPQPNSNCQEKVGGGYICWTEGSSIIDRQVVVTYRHEEDWAGPVTSYLGDDLPKTMAALREKKDLTLLMFGDSISTGANSSGYLGIYPDMPPFPQLLAEKLEYVYGGNVTLKNESVGGMLSDWGAKNITGAMLKSKADLAVIAFGMNDGSWDIPVEQYKANTKAIIDGARQVNPDVELILVGTMLANPLAKNQSKGQEKYFPALQELAAEYEGVVAVDIGGMHSELLTKKEYVDMTANNINHPNDFMARIYAMNLSAALIEDQSK